MNGCCSLVTGLGVVVAAVAVAVVGGDGNGALRSTKAAAVSLLTGSGGIEDESLLPGRVEPTSWMVESGPPVNVIADPGVGGRRTDSSFPNIGLAAADGLVVVVVPDDEKVLRVALGRLDALNPTVIKLLLLSSSSSS